MFPYSGALVLPHSDVIGSKVFSVMSLLKRARIFLYSPGPLIIFYKREIAVTAGNLHIVSVLDVVDVKFNFEIYDF